MWRLCIYYKSIKSVSSMFEFLIKWCKDMVLHIEKLWHGIPLYMDSGYLHILVHHLCIPKLSFLVFKKNVKLDVCWFPECVPSICGHNRCHTSWLKSGIRQNRRPWHRFGINNGWNYVIFLLLDALLNCIEVILEVLSHYQCTLKLNIIIFLGTPQ